MPDTPDSHRTLGTFYPEVLGQGTFKYLRTLVSRLLFQQLQLGRSGFVKIYFQSKKKDSRNGKQKVKSLKQIKKEKDSSFSSKRRKLSLQPDHCTAAVPQPSFRNPPPKNGNAVTLDTSKHQPVAPALSPLPFPMDSLGQLIKGFWTTHQGA